MRGLSYDPGILPSEMIIRHRFKPINDIPREAIIAGGVLVQCPRCYNDSYRLNVNGLTHYWCDKCANSITSESK